MTMVAGSGGNAGVQTLALVVRGLALGELTFLNARRVVLKEFMTGALNGLALGLVAAVLAYFWKGVPLIGVRRRDGHHRATSASPRSSAC